jgi:hypothetical protein
MKWSLIALTLMMFFAAPVFSQSPPGPPPVDRSVNTDRIRQQNMSSREWQLRNFGNERGGIKDQRQLKALMAQTEEDFTRILTLHNEIARAISSEHGLDYKFVSEASAEIKKRAARVQSNLKLAPEDGQTIAKPEEFDDAHMKDGLIKLCKQIRSFVTNPMIEQPNTVDAQQLTRARADLEGVIQLSAQIKKDADKLSRSRQ